MLSILPRCGLGLYRLISSMNITPGSPVSQAIRTIWSNTCTASSCPTTSLVRGLTRSYSSPAEYLAMKSSVTATDMLKLLRFLPSFLDSTNFNMSGWSTFIIAMLAPRRVPPCFTTSVAVSKARMKLTGPLATPPVEPTKSPSGRRLLKEKPVPPPLLWINAVCLTCSNMESSESPTGNTKHAASCWISRPAFISVGELGIVSRLRIAAKNSSSISCRCSSDMLYSVHSAIDRSFATRRNMPSASSTMTFSRSLAR